MNQITPLHHKDQLTSFYQTLKSIKKSRNLSYRHKHIYMKRLERLDLLSLQERWEEDLIAVYIQSDEINGQR